VRNGSITGFSEGVNLFSAGGSTVEGLRVFRNFVTGIIANGIVKGNIALESFFDNGISATGIVTGNIASGNRRSGIEVGQGSTVIGNTVTDNHDAGLLVSCPSNVTDNTVINNAGLETPGPPNIRLFGDGCNNTNNVAP
jgi:parallel beta-helix repeat protein